MFTRRKHTRVLNQLDDELWAGMAKQLETSDETAAQASDFVETSVSAEHHAGCCPVCMSQGTECFEQRGYEIHECRDCQHRMLATMPSQNHLSDVYDDDYFFGGGAGYSNYLSEQQLLTAHGKRYAKLLAQYTEPSRMLDVGCAAGFIADGYRQLGWEPSGLEPNPKVGEFARTQLNIPVTTGALEDLTTDEPFHLISMIQVIAHFHDLRSAIDRAATVTAPNGYWLIETWNFNSWTARIFGRHWHEYSPPSVLNWFSPQSLRLLCEQFGMQMIAKGRPTKRLDGEHAKSLLNYRLGKSRVGRGLSKLIDCVVPDRLPIPYPSEDLFWMLLQKH